MLRPFCSALAGDVRVVQPDWYVFGMSQPQQQLLQAVLKMGFK